MRREKVAVLTQATLTDQEMLAHQPEAAYLMALAELPVPGGRGGACGAARRRGGPGRRPGPGLARTRRHATRKRGNGARGALSGAVEPLCCRLQGTPLIVVGSRMPVPLHCPHALQRS